MYIPQDSPLVLHLPTSWRPARSMCRGGTWLLLNLDLPLVGPVRVGEAEEEQPARGRECISRGGRMLGNRTHPPLQHHPHSKPCNPPETIKTNKSRTRILEKWTKGTDRGDARVGCMIVLFLTA